MAVEQALVVRFRGDITNLNQAIQSGIRNLGEFESVAGRMGRSVAAIFDGISKGNSFQAPDISALVQGLKDADSLLRSFGRGAANVAQVNVVLEKLIQHKDALGDTRPLDQLIQQLQKLSTQKAVLPVEAKFDIPAVLSEIEKFKTSLSPAQTAINIDANVSGLVEGLNTALSALQKFSSGEAFVNDLNTALVRLANSKDALKNPAFVESVNAIIESLKRLSQQARGIKIPIAIEARENLKGDVENLSGQIAKLFSALQTSGRSVTVPVEVKPQVGAAGLTKDLKLPPVQLTFEADNRGFSSVLRQVNLATREQVAEIQKNLSSVTVTAPSIQAFLEGLSHMESVLRRLAIGTATVQELDAALGRLSQSREKLGNSAAVDGLLRQLTALRNEASKNYSFNIHGETNVEAIRSNISNLLNSIGSREIDIDVKVNESGINNLKKSTTDINQTVISTASAGDRVAAAFSKITNLDFSTQFDAARSKVAAWVNSLDAAGNKVSDLQKRVQAFGGGGVALPKLNAQIAVDKLQIQGELTKAFQPLKDQKISLPVGVTVTGNAQLGLLQKLEAQYNRFNQAAKKATDIEHLARYNRALEATQSRINNLQRIRTPFDKIKKGANESTLALVDLGRIFSDLPFGILGVSNNLVPMVDSFNRLRAQSGSTKAALQSMAAGLLGPGGIGVGISVVSALLITFGDKMFSSASAAKTQAEKIKEAKQALEDYVETLSAVEQVSLRGAQGAQDELVKLQGLRDAIHNVNTPLSERKRLIDDIQKQYPAYFGNLSQEAILAGQDAKAYSDLAQSILAAASAEAGRKALIENVQQQLVLQQQLKANEKDRLKTLGELQKAQQNAVAPTPQLTPEGDVSVANAMGQLTAAQRKYNNAVSEGASKLTQLKKLQQDAADVQKFVTDNLRLSLPKFNAGSVDALNNQLQTLKARFDALSDADRKGAIGIKITADIRDVEEKLKKITDSISIKTKQGPKAQIDFFGSTFDALPETILKKLEGINTLSVNLKPAQTRLVHSLNEMAKAAKEFAHKNFNLFEGLKGIVAEVDPRKIVELGRKFWEDFKRGLIRLKPPKIDVGALELVPVIKETRVPDPRLVLAGAEGGPFDQHTFDVPLNKDQILKNFETKFRQLNAELPKIIERIQPTTGLTETVSIKAEFNTANLQNGLQQQLEGIRNRMANYQKGLQDAFSSAFQNIKITGFEAIGQALGAALSGGDISNVFQNFANQIGDIVQQLGQELIKLGVIASGIKVSLANIFANPGLAIAAGVALVALGSSIKQLLPGHKDGLNFVPFDDYVCRLHRGEMVLNADQARAFRGVTSAMRVPMAGAIQTTAFAGNIQTAPAAVQVFGQIRGGDIVLSSARTGRRQNRGG